MNYKRHLLTKDSSVKEALIKLNDLASDAILFITDNSLTLLGSITDGDLRRGFIRGLNFDSPIIEFAQPNPKYIQQNNYDLKTIINLRENNFSIFPIVDSNKRVINVVNFKHQKSYLPIDATIMAGGRGERLRPLTDTVPKPMLPVGDKPIIEHNIDRLKNYGIDDLWISLGYKGEQIENYFNDGSSKSIRIKYLHEKAPLGTAGALSLVNTWSHPTILLMNSDLLTNLDYEDLYLHFISSEADLAVVSIPYSINVPYAVFELENNRVLSLREKPTFTYYSNAGIYLMKREVIHLIPQNEHFNATDLIEQLIQKGRQVITYPFLGYWLDIGRHEDYRKAQENINFIKF